ncbi:hypothetical protein KJ940_12405, partial [Myxococcota bacterium]|nr:hypothetical protein [Myxococcota bacterium]
AAAAAEAHRSAPPARAASGDAEELELALEDERRDRRAAQKAKAKLEVQLKGLTQQIEALEAELQAAREGSAAPTAAATTSGDFEILYQQSVEAYEQINDLASDLRSNIDLSQSCLGDLSGLIEAAVEATQRGLDANMAQRLRVAVDEADPEWNLPSSREALEKAHSTSESFKKALIRFRKILKQYGYEG